MPSQSAHAAGLSSVAAPASINQQLAPERAGHRDEMRRDRRVGDSLSCRSIRNGAMLAACIAGLSFSAAPTSAATPGLTELSLEELANIEITSVARRPAA